MVRVPVSKHFLMSFEYGMDPVRMLVPVVIAEQSKMKGLRDTPASVSQLHVICKSSHALTISTMSAHDIIFIQKKG